MGWNRRRAVAQPDAGWVGKHRFRVRSDALASMALLTPTNDERVYPVVCLGPVQERVGRDDRAKGRDGGGFRVHRECTSVGGIRHRIGAFG